MKSPGNLMSAATVVPFAGAAVGQDTLSEMTNKITDKMR